MKLYLYSLHAFMVRPGTEPLWCNQYSHLLQARQSVVSAHVVMKFSLLYTCPFTLEIGQPPLQWVRLLPRDEAALSWHCPLTPI